MKSIPILQFSLLASILLATCVFFQYRGPGWPGGFEALGCLVSIGILTGTWLLIRFYRAKVQTPFVEDQVKWGLLIGLLWTIEISINNFIQPGMPLRDNIDNSFWAFIAICILLLSILAAFRAQKFGPGLRSGFWSGLASGAVACLTALALIVFGMLSILRDPLNLKEWSDVHAEMPMHTMAVYFAYQTFTGAILHLVILGALMGLILGVLGEGIGWLARLFVPE